MSDSSPQSEIQPSGLTIAVTGASGFVGQALLPWLEREGHRCLALPSQHLMQSIASCAEAIAGADVLVHLAALAHTDGASAEDYQYSNVDLSERAARAAAEAGAKRFVFLSSVKVYGEYSLNPFDEGSTPAPLGAYAQTKLEAEQRLKKLTAELGLELVILRCPLVYAVGAKGNLASLRRALRRGLPLPLGAIRNRRDLIARENLCDLITLCCHHPKAVDDIVLACDGQALSSADVARVIAALEKLPVRLLPIPPSWLRLLGRLLGKQAAIDRLTGNFELDNSATCARLQWQAPIQPQDLIARER